MNNNEFIETEGNKFAKVFSQVGMYNIAVYAKNAVGILSEPAWVTVEVKASNSEPSLKDRMVCWFPLSESSLPATDLHRGFTLDTEEGSISSSGNRTTSNDTRSS